MRIAPLTVPALLFLASGCGPAAPAAISDADKAAMEALDQSFAKQAVGGDYAALVKSYYTEDAIAMAPNMPSSNGHAAIEAMLHTFPPITAFQIRTDEIVGMGDMAYVRGHYAMTMAPPGMAAVSDSGKYLEIFKKQADGSWKVIRDMFNSDVPMPPPAPAAVPSAPKKK